MALQVSVQYQGQPVVFDIEMREENVFQLRLGQPQRENGSYIPEKIIIRKKGMIWVSDAENYKELVSALAKEITAFETNKI